MEVQLMLPALIVSFALTAAWPANEEVSSLSLAIKNGSSKVGQDFEYLFDSIRKNDTRRTETFRQSLEQDVAREQKSFGTMKDELQFTRGLRHAHEQIYGESPIEKRETNKDRAESAPENNGEPAPKSEIETLENEIQALYKEVARLETKQKIDHWKFKTGLNRYPQNEMPMPKDLESALKVISEYFEKYRDVLDLLIRQY